MLNEAADADIMLFCYEGDGTLPLRQILSDKPELRDRDIAIVIGSEGGFSQKEVERARECGATLVGLGKRILRTETASGFVLSCLVYELEL